MQMQRGLVSNIQKYSLQDGPGIRTTVFLKGCPLQCAWCHNPENISPAPQVLLFKTRCVRCGECRTVCPRLAELAGGPEVGTAGQEAQRLLLPSEGEGECLVCGACVEACPTAARVMIGKRLSVADVLTEVMADQIFY